jgi:RNA polymerase sigma-70 factor (ECF subfamily)
MQRSNEQWRADLRSAGAAREAALDDLRALLVRGLNAGLSGWGDGAAGGFSAQVEDFAQESLLKVLANLEAFEGRSQFTTWAYKIAIRVALTELRRRRWHDVSLDELTASDGPGRTPSWSADPNPDPGQHAVRRDAWQHLRRVMDEELTDRQRTALMAVALQGMPLEEVARRMGTERNALYKLLHDARRRLKSRLAEVGLSPGDFFDLAR